MVLSSSQANNQNLAGQQKVIFQVLQLPATERWSSLETSF